MKACDTCAHLKVPANEDHARHYRVCTVVTPLPANMHFWDRDAIEGRIDGQARWITTKSVDDKIFLKDCELHKSLATKSRPDPDLDRTLSAVSDAMNETQGES